VNKKLLFSLPCIVWLVAAVVARVPLHTSSDYHLGLIIGRAIAPCIPLLLLVRIWTGPDVSREVASHGTQYGVAFLMVAALGAGVGIVRSAPHAGLTRAQGDMEAGLTDGCSRISPRPLCACIAKQLVERDGYDTTEELLTLQPALLRAQATGNAAAVPVPVRAATVACAQQLHAT
jgi:hypothetical protein